MTRSQADAVFAAIQAAKTAGCRVTRIRLTEGERDELRAITGQDAILLGYPVAPR